MKRSLRFALFLAVVLAVRMGVAQDELFKARTFVAPDTFTSGAEGPACAVDGALYAVGYGEMTDGSSASGTLGIMLAMFTSYNGDFSIGRVTAGGESSAFVDMPEGSSGNGIRFNREGDMLVADYAGHNVLKVDMETRVVSVFAHESSMNQPNDLAIGADGRIYASDPNWRESTGQIWRIDTDGVVTRLEADMGTTNGIEVSADEKTLYVNESVQRKVWAYDLSGGGEVSNKRLLLEFEDGGMDGMRCDVDGNLYIARYGKGAVVQVSAAGEVLREIELSGENPTNIAFGGADGRTCYVTVKDKGNIEMFRVDRPGRSWALNRGR